MGKKTSKHGMRAVIVALLALCIALPLSVTAATRFVIENVGEGFLSSIAVDENGVPHMSYVHRLDGKNVVLKHAVRTGGAWNVETVTTVSTEGAGAYSSIAVDGDGNPHIAYDDTVNGELRYAVKMGGIWSIETVDPDDGGRGVSIVLDSQGVPHIGYQEISENRPVYATKSGGAWITEIADWGAFDPECPDTRLCFATRSISLALDSQGVTVHS